MKNSNKNRKARRKNFETRFRYVCEKCNQSTIVDSFERQKSCPLCGSKRVFLDRGTAVS